MKKLGLLKILLSLTLAFGVVWWLFPPQIKPYGPVPTPAQVEWQRMEMNMFCHFGPNTFTGKEWGDGDEKESLFNPTHLDCNQWARVAKQAGMKGIILTAKHHDGFCLWPNPMSEHTVAQSPWKEGGGDVLQELSQACAKNNVKFGIYISPWDRNAPTYGTPDYNEVFRRTVAHALTHYGDVFEQWFDGACGEGPNGKRQVYDWKMFNSEVYANQPNAVIFSDVGPGCRWVGNEQGKAPATCWSRLDTIGFAPGHGPATDSLGQGNYLGACWIPAEVDVSIRDGWFYRASEHPKSVDQLVDIYLNSVGHNALLLLNVPPDTNGLICAEDSLRLMEFRATLDAMFAKNLAQEAVVDASSRFGRTFRAKHLTDGNFDTYWASKNHATSATIDLLWDSPREIHYIVLQEYIPLGQRVKSFHVEALVDRQWEVVAEATTIGYKRIIPVENCKTASLRIVIDDSRAEILLNNIEVY